MANKLKDNKTKSEAEVIWKACLEIIKANIDENEYEVFFKDIVPQKYENKELTIHVKSAFIQEYLEDNYAKLLRKVLNRVIGPDAKLKYSMKITNKDRIEVPSVFKEEKVENPPIIDKNKIPSPLAIPGLEHGKGIDTNLNSLYTFENFLEGENNKVARALAQGIAKSYSAEAIDKNVLYFYGKSGVGKTHLLHAIGSEIKRNNRNVIVYYTTSEKFLNDYIKATQNKSIQSWANFFNNIDVLLMDDIDYIIGKKKTIEFFFNIFNSFIQKRKLIVITGDCPPSSYTEISEKLRSRLASGITLEIKPPDFETRVKILKYKIQGEGIEFSDEIINYIAQNIKNNVRELEGAILTLLTQSIVLKKNKIDFSFAKKIIEDLVATSKTPISVENIKSIVANYFGVSVEDMEGKSRKQQIVTARQIAMYFIKERLGLTLEAIGSHFGGRDHSTVINATKRVREQLDIKTETPYKRAVKEIEEQINNFQEY